LPAIFIVQLAFLLSLAWLLRAVGGLRGASLRVGLGLAAYCLFCPSQWENLSWPFQISFVLPGLFVILALLALVQYAKSAQANEGGGYYLGGSILALCAATYSNANGVVAWPVLVLAALALRVRLQVIAVYIIAGALLVSSYLYHYSSPPYHSSPLASLHHPAVIIEYLAKYFGGSWFHSPRHLYVVGFGLAGLAAALAMAWWELARKASRPAPVVLLGLIAFSLGTAFITALGRINFGTDQAFASRYQTFTLLFWFSLGMLLLAVLAERNRRIPVTLLLTVAALMMLMSAGQYRSALRTAQGRAGVANLAGSAFLTGVMDPVSLKELFPDPEFVWGCVGYLREHRLSVFATGLSSRLEKPVADVYQADAMDSCKGHVDGVEPVASDSKGVRVWGWAVEQRSGKAVQGILAAVGGRIEGFGISGFPRPDVARVLRSTRALNSGWSGYARIAGQSGPIVVYGIVDESRRKLCTVGSAPVPAR
jgi:hypothetical protein